MEIPSFLVALYQNGNPFTGLLNADPVLRGVQAGLGVSAFLLVMLVFYATRDILRRTNSLIIQIFCIMLVALLPVAGFLIYMLIRPSQTLSERQIQEDVLKILTLLTERKDALDQVKKRVEAKATQRKNEANERVKSAVLPNVC